MKLKLATLACATAYLSGCSSPKPTIDLEQLDGVYRAPSCPPIQIADKQLSYNGEQSSFELIRIKDHDIMATATTPRFALGNTCKLVVDGEPSYIQIDLVDGRFAFDIFSTNRTTAIRFVRDE